MYAATGVSVKNQFIGVEKGMVNSETLQAVETFNKDAGLSKAVSKAMETTDPDLNINGQTMFNLYFGGVNTNHAKKLKISLK